MKYLKKINEYMSYNDDFKFYTQNIKDVTIDFTDKNIDDMKGTASVEWYLDFNYKGNKGVEIFPVIQSVTIYLHKDIYIDNEGNTEEEYEEIYIEDNNIKVKRNNIEDDKVNILFYPNSIYYNYDKKEIIVFF